MIFTLFLILAHSNTPASNVEPACDVPEMENAAEFDISQVLSIQWWLRHLADAYTENPYHMVTELTFIVLIIYLLFRRQEKSEGVDLTESERDEILKAWSPDPLVPDFTPNPHKTTINLAAATSETFTHNGKTTLNFVSSNFLGLANHEAMKEEASRTIQKYAVGSCGPRGFYGTIDVHLNLEQKLGKVFSEGGDPVKAVIYADWLGVPSSVITAFAKKGDLVIADENIHWLFKQGILMSRVKAIYYRHNDLDHLEEILQEIQQKDNQDSHFQLNRRFIVTESVYENSGKILDLPRVMKLKNRYKYRLIVDDSNGLGTLDKKGIAGYYNIATSEIDVYCSSMDKSLGSIGGFVVGNDEITNRQTLYSFGYVFSASAPPFQVNCAALALDLNTRDLTARLSEKIKMFRQCLDDKLTKFKIISHPESPIIFLNLADSDSSCSLMELKKWYTEQGLFLFCSEELPKDKYDGTPYLRLTVTVLQTKQMFLKAAKILADGEQKIAGSAATSI